MRVQLRLSQESEAILRFQKNEYEKMEGVSPTYGWLVNKRVHEIARVYENIDWEIVKEKKIANLPQIEKGRDLDYSTTLNLEQTVLNYIEKFQIDFKRIFKAARVHKALVIRMVLRASYLIDQGIKIKFDESKSKL